MLGRRASLLGELARLADFTSGRLDFDVLRRFEPFEPWGPRAPNLYVIDSTIIKKIISQGNLTKTIKKA
jgi:hypothetical protein